MISHAWTGMPTIVITFPDLFYPVIACSSRHLTSIGPILYFILFIQSVCVQVQTLVYVRRLHEIHKLTV